MRTSLLCALATGALTASIHAQSSPCLSFNDANNNVSTGITASPFVGRNPNSRGYQFTPTTSFAPLSATIYTGSPIHDDYMRVEIWDEDPNTQAPGNRLAVGTFFSAMSPTANWLGANFDTAPTLSQGVPYWFVWIESGASIIPEEPNGNQLPRMTRSSTNAWGGLAAGAVKFRLYCNLLDGQNVTTFGAPCRTAANQLPTAFTNDSPTAGNAGFGIEGTNLPAGASAWMLVGFDPNAATTPLGGAFPAGCALHTDIIAAISGMTGVAEIGDQPSTPRPSPFGHVRFALPLTNAISGVFFSTQLIGFDGSAAAPVPLVLTNAVRVTTL